MLDALVRRANADGHGDDAKALADLISELPADDATGAAVLEALQGATPRTWARLDERLRNDDIYRNGHVHGRRAASKARLTSEIGLLRALCSADGRVREMALRRRVDMSRLLPVVVLRAADWAGPVADRARALLPGLLRDALGSADARAVTAVGMAAHLAGRRRGDVVLGLVTDLLADASPEALAAVRGADDRHARRLAYRIWLDGPDVEARGVLDAMLAEGDNVCRAWCGRFLVERVVAGGCPDLVEPLLSAGSGVLRAMALDALVRSGRPERGRECLGDRSAAVRSVAQWAVRRLGEDPASLYREALASYVDDGTAAVAGAILGSGECGGREDVAVVEPFLRHARPRVRAAAVRTIASLGGRDGWPVLLTDPAPVVVRTVGREVIAREVIVPVEELRGLLRSAGPLHVRRAAHLLLAWHGTWTRLEADLWLLAVHDPDLGPAARSDLHIWLDRDARAVYGRPPAGVGEELARLVRVAGGELREGAERRLRWQLGLARES
ncbi:hypothetical protein EBO15_34920 [Actinomadura harenae]|uniref:HEAT repeat domain-containing protein n=2 Tax=Actinomadura harenae TaxID=2483351 RepID=A0A3M2LSD9_9ACTN|nr:hypothetical protein EBO15_34920 [Actinomadura harenae]